MDEKTLLEVIKTRNDLKRKYRSIRQAESSRETFFDNVFKPISKSLAPLEEIITASRKPQIHKSESIREEDYEEKDSKKNFIPKTSTPKAKNIKSEYIDTELSKENDTYNSSSNDNAEYSSDDDNAKFYTQPSGSQQFEADISKQDTDTQPSGSQQFGSDISKQDTESNSESEETVESTGNISLSASPSPLQEHKSGDHNDSLIESNLLQLEENGDLDSVYGPHRDTEGKWRYGNSAFQIYDNSISVGDNSWHMTPGLFQLLFHKKPRNYDDGELEIYGEILDVTNAARRQFDSTKQIKGTRAFKYQSIIKPLYESKKKPSIQTYKGSTLMKLNTTKPKYVFWKDPNILVKRLRFLLSQSSDLVNQNEIISIIEELKEANIIF